MPSTLTMIDEVDLADQPTYAEWVDGRNFALWIDEAKVQPMFDIRKYEAESPFAWVNDSANVWELVRQEFVQAQYLHGVYGDRSLLHLLEWYREQCEREPYYKEAA